jgi:hypothetical protein
MYLSAHLLDNVSNVNEWTIVPSIDMHEGDPVTIFVMLVDLSKDRDNRPAGRRYIPVTVPTTLGVVVQNIDDGKKLVKVATQPFATDSSIWSFNIAGTDTSVKGTVDLVLTLTEGAIVRNTRIRCAIRVHTVIPVELNPTKTGTIFG